MTNLAKPGFLEKPGFSKPNYESIKGSVAPGKTFGVEKMCRGRGKASAQRVFSAFASWLLPKSGMFSRQRFCEPPI
jgi:hypothetical protein